METSLFGHSITLFSFVVTASKSAASVNPSRSERVVTRGDRTGNDDFLAFLNDECRACQKTVSVWRPSVTLGKTAQ